jgi:protein DGCR14
MFIISILKKQENALTLENGNRGTDDSITRPLDSWTYTAKNTLMYIPEGVPLTDQQELELAKRTRIINHSNTRFNSEMLKSLSETSSIINTPNSQNTQNKMNPTIKIITKIGVDGKEAVSSDTPKVRGI